MDTINADDIGVKIESEQRLRQFAQITLQERTCEEVAVASGERFAS